MPNQRLLTCVEVSQSGSHDESVAPARGRTGRRRRTIAVGPTRRVAHHTRARTVDRRECNGSGAGDRSISADGQSAPDRDRARRRRIERQDPACAGQAGNDLLGQEAASCRRCTAGTAVGVQRRPGTRRGNDRRGDRSRRAGNRRNDVCGPPTWHRLDATLPDRLWLLDMRGRRRGRRGRRCRRR